jgi:hypothetical protein
VILRRIDCDPVDPGKEGTLAPKAAQRAVGLDEGLLRHIHRLFAIMHVAISQLYDPVLVFQNENIKRRLVALLDPFNQCLIYAAFAHPGCLPSTRNHPIDCPNSG